MKKALNIIEILTFCIVLVIMAGCEPKKTVDNRGEFYITSKPDEAKILINNVEKGVTPKSIKLVPGAYIMEVSKLNYRSNWQKIVSNTGDRKNIEIELAPITSSVLIESKPAGAILEIDGKQVGQTPLILHDQTIGKHSARLSKPGCITQEINWSVEDARPQVAAANLFSNVGTLEIKSTPNGANVLLDNKPRGKTPFSGTMEQGEHKISVELKGYNSHEENVVVTKDEKKDVSVILQILPGNLNVKTNPPGAAITLNDRPYQNSPVEIKNLQPGDYKLKVEKEGSDPVVKDIKITAGETSDISINLDSNWGGIDLIANPPGVTIYVDGKKLGVSGEGEDKLTSKVFEIRNLSSQEHIIRIAHKRAVPSEKTINVKVEKGQISRPKPITMWIADTYVKLKNGREMRGKIRQQNNLEIILEQPDEGGHGIIAQRYGRNEMETIRELKENE
jgi:hypothetical protein